MCIVLLLQSLVTAVAFFPIKFMFVAFTNHSMILTTVTVVLCIRAAESPELYGNLKFLKQRGKVEYKETYQRFKVLHFLYSFSLVASVIVVIVYWTLLHHVFIEKMHAKGYSDLEYNQKVFHIYTVHSLVPLACWMNAASTNIVLAPEFWKLIPVFGTLFGLMMCAYVKNTGVVVYHFMNFNDGLWSWLHVLFINVMGVVLC